MKQVIVFLAALFLIVSFNLSAETVVADDGFSSKGSAWSAGYGDWKVQSGRLYQMDSEEPLAKINLRVPQSGVMQYEFHAKYVDGGMDGHAGFGVHIFVDRAFNGRSWGNGNSYLLWLNYDVNTDDMEHYGYRAQLYKSTGHSTMKVVDAYNLKIPSSFLKQEYLFADIPVKLRIDADTGEVRAYNPLRSDYYYYFYLPEDLSRGSYFSVRTNSLAASFDNLRITKIQ